MPTWFSCKIKYARMLESGKQIAISKQFLIDALSFTEAEERLFIHIGSQISDYILTNISRYKIYDIFPYDDGDIWYKVKTVYVSQDENSGKEVKLVQPMLVTAQDAGQAYERVKENLSGSVTDFMITDVNVTGISEIFPYTSPSEAELPDTQSSAAAKADPEAQNSLQVDRENIDGFEQNVGKVNFEIS